MAGLAQAMGIRSGIQPVKFWEKGPPLILTREKRKGGEHRGGETARGLPLCRIPAPALSLESFKSNTKCQLTAFPQLCVWQTQQSVKHLCSLALPWPWYHHFRLLIFSRVQEFSLKPKGELVLMTGFFQWMHTFSVSVGSWGQFNGLLCLLMPQWLLGLGNVLSHLATSVCTPVYYSFSLVHSLLFFILLGPLTN